MLAKMGILTKFEYECLKGLWMKNHSDCKKCRQRWDEVLIAHEPDTEYLTLTYEERMKSIETNYPEDKGSYIHFK